MTAAKSFCSLVLRVMPDIFDIWIESIATSAQYNAVIDLEIRITAVQRSDVSPKIEATKLY